MREAGGRGFEKAFGQFSLKACAEEKATHTKLLITKTKCKTMTTTKMPAPGFLYCTSVLSQML